MRFPTLLLSSFLVAGCDAFGETRDLDAASGGTPSGVSDGGSPGFFPPALGVTGGASPTSEPLVEVRAIEVHEDPARPLFTRGFVFSPDGSRAYVADPANRRVTIVPLSGATPTALDFAEVGVPARLFLLGEFVYVTFRDVAKIARITPVSGGSLSYLALPSSAEGLSLAGSSLFVACRDGRLLTLDPTTLETKRTLHLPDDLRDVLPRADGTLFVTRFRSAELLHLDENGKLLATLRPAFEGIYEPSVAWKTLLLPDGNAIMLHLLARGVRGNGAFYYGDAPVELTVSVLSTVKGMPPIGTTPTDELLDPLAGYTRERIRSSGSGFGDLAANGTAFALIRPGKSFPMPENAYEPAKETWFDPSHSVLCFTVSPNVEGTPTCSGSDTLTAIATHPTTGVAWVMDLGARRLRALDGSSSVEFSVGTKNDAFAFFHIERGGVACASCHPEGREDGLEWDFEGFPTRTQTLEAGLGIAPMHRRGELATLGEFMNAVFRDRFSGITLNPKQLDVMGAFLGAIEAPPPSSVTPDEAGKQLFESGELGCATCHFGELGSDALLHDVGTGGPFLTPPLFRIGYRAPFMHDGAARTLFEVLGLAGGGDSHSKTSNLSNEERKALANYVSTL